MLNSRTSARILSTIAAILGFASCANNIGQKAEENNDPEISNFQISECLKSASQTYVGVIDSDSLYISLSTSIQWPETLGDHNISALKRHILETAYESDTLSIHSLDINKAIMNFVTTPQAFFDNEQGDSVSFVRVDTLSTQGETMSDLQAEIEGRIIAISPTYVTYSIETMSYLGGAHPNASITPFTFDLDKSMVIAYDDLFNANSQAIVSNAITAELAARNNVSPSRLTEVGFFSNNITPSKMVYVSNDYLVFHYNPYDIAPYSSGMIDVEVSPYELRDALTPYGCELLGVE